MVQLSLNVTLLIDTTEFMMFFMVPVMQGLNFLDAIWELLLVNVLTHCVWLTLQRAPAQILPTAGHTLLAGVRSPIGEDCIEYFLVLRTHAANEGCFSYCCRSIAYYISSYSNGLPCITSHNINRSKGVHSSELKSF